MDIEIKTIKTAEEVKQDNKKYKGGITCLVISLIVFVIAFFVLLGIFMRD